MNVIAFERGLPNEGTANDEKLIINSVECKIEINKWGFKIQLKP